MVSLNSMTHWLHSHHPWPEPIYTSLPNIKTLIASFLCKSKHTHTYTHTSKQTTTITMIIKNKYFLLIVGYNAFSYTRFHTPLKLAPHILPVLSVLFFTSFSCSLNKKQGKAWLRPLLGPDSYIIFSFQNIFNPNLHMHQANKPKTNWTLRSGGVIFEIKCSIMIKSSSPDSVWYWTSYFTSLCLFILFIHKMEIMKVASKLNCCQS